MRHDDSEVEVRFKPENGKAIIEGKTTVPFQSFVTLVLQRKVIPMFKQWGKHSVIIDSELLTNLASAPQDSQENRSNIIMVSLLAGILLGIAGLAAVQIGLLLLEIPLGYKELGMIIGSLLILVFLIGLLMKMQRKPKGEKLVETMERVSGFLSSKK